MAIYDYFWLPATGVVSYGWVWVCRRWVVLKPIRGRTTTGIVGLSLATAAALSLFASVMHSWVVGRFTWHTPFDIYGLLLALIAAAVGILGKGRLRLLTLLSAVLSFAAWWAFLAARRHSGLGF